MPFTDKQIAGLRPRARRYEKSEPGRSGLHMRVAPNGAKAWVFRYRLDGTHRRMVLGTYPKMGLRQAHVALADARDKLRSGIDPGAVVAEARRAERDAETVADLAAEYLEHHARKFQKPATAGQDEAYLNREILPVWGHRKAKEITRRDAIKLLDAIEARGAPVSRNRVASLLSKLFHVALDRGVVEAHPAIRLRRLQETPRERVLSPEEINGFWHGLDRADMTEQSKVALRFALVTGQRRAEIAGTRREEIDDDGLWRLPAERTKNGRGNIVPLPPLALRLIAEADRLRVRPLGVRPNRKDRRPHDPAPSIWLFPSTVMGKPLEPAALTRAFGRNRAALGFDGGALRNFRSALPTVHDLRRSFATYHGELGTAPEILSALLNHAPQSITDRVYNKAKNLAPRRAAMTRWGEWLELVIAGKYAEAQAMFGAEVVPLDQRVRA